MLYLLFLASVVSYYGVRFIYHSVLSNPKYDSVNKFVLSDILEILNIAIDLQFTVYDNNIFSGEERILNSSSFENYYNDITTHVIKFLSPSFFKKAAVYFNEEALIELICSMVKEYLEKKVSQ